MCSAQLSEAERVIADAPDSVSLNSTESISQQQLLADRRNLLLAHLHVSEVCDQLGLSQSLAVQAMKLLRQHIAASSIRTKNIEVIV